MGGKKRGTISLGNTGIEKKRQRKPRTRKPPEQVAASREISNRNLRPWQPGQSGNPHGNTSPRIVTQALKGLLAQVAPDPEGKLGGATYAELISRALVTKALRGDVAAIKEIADRTEGKARQKVDVTIAPQTEVDRYERLVADLQSEAISIGAQATRADIIRMIGEGDPRIIEVLSPDAAPTIDISGDYTN